MTEKFYKAGNYNTDYSTFGGEIYKYDFDRKITLSEMAERIARDKNFDRQRKKDIESKNRPRI